MPPAAKSATSFIAFCLLIPPFANGDFSELVPQESRRNEASEQNECTGSAL